MTAPLDAYQIRDVPSSIATNETTTAYAPAAEILREAAYGSPVDASLIERVRIVRAPGGGQIRTVITGSKQVRTLAYVSKRYGCIRYGEATTECTRLPAEELCPLTVQAVAQFARIEALVEGRWYRTIVDGAAVYADGTAALIECKRDWALFRTPGAQTQSVLARLGARCLGMRYERYVLANAGSEKRQANVDEVQSCRFVHVSDALSANISAMLHRGSASLLSVANALSPEYHLGRAMAFALMAGRTIEIDLEGDLGPWTECRATPRPSPSIHDLEAA